MQDRFERLALVRNVVQPSLGFPEDGELVWQTQFGRGFAGRLNGRVGGPCSFGFEEVEGGLVLISAVVLPEAVVLPRGLSWRVIDVEVGGAHTGVPVFVALRLETGRFGLASVVSAGLVGLRRLDRPIVPLCIVGEREMGVLFEHPAALGVLFALQPIDAAAGAFKHIDALHLDHLSAGYLLFDLNGGELGRGGGVAVRRLGE